jgi:PAS domain S-box-containing protein
VQDQALAAATGIVRELRQGRIDLYQGFLHAVLARGDASPWERGRGLALMEQGVAELRGALKKVDDPTGQRLQQELAQFALVLGRAGAVDARREVELRLAFYDLDLAAQRVDRQLHADLESLRRRLAAVFWGVLALSSAMLTLVSIGAVRSGRREAAAMAARRESEERFRLLFDHSPQPVVVHTGGIIELANAAALAMMGVQRQQDVVGRHLLDFVDASRRRQSAATLARLAAEPAVAPIATLPARKPDGTPLRLEVTTASFRQGNAMRMLTAMRDVTERRAARLALRDSARRLRDVIDLVPHAIYAKDADGRYLLANRTTASYLGREPHELLGRRPDEFGLDPADAECDREVDRDVLRTQRRRDGEVVRRFHGEDIAFAFSKIPFSFGGQVTDAVLGVSTDISGLKRAEAQLKESLALLQATLQSTDNGVLVTNLEGRLLLWNERMVALLGSAEALHLGDKAAVLAALGSHRLPTELASTVQQLGRRADGRFIESHAQPMLIDGLRAGRVWTFRDVTEREQALADAQAREQELEARVQERTRSMAQAYAELQSFSDAVSHDLRAPLAAIDAFAQVLLYKHAADLGPAARHHVERILASSANMRAMIHGLLELSRHARAPVHRRPLDLGAMARQAYELQADALGERRVDFEVEEGLQASGDPVLVATLLQNLVGNALKYSRDRDPARIRVGRGSADGGPCFFVRDNGAGFDPAYADRLFKPFSRLHQASEFEGHGIGLATASRIVARHGGRIWAEGAPGQGATFCFTLE